jgi:hypothetical protein
VIVQGERDISEWRELARSMSRREFVEDHPYPFLLRKRMTRTAPVPGAAPQPVSDWNDAMQFNTDVVDVEQLPTRSVGRITGSKIVPIQKSDRNPFSGQISVGRAKNCDIILRDQTVSKHHAYLRVLGPSSAEVVDMSSQNTTRVNGAPATPGEAHPLESGDTLTFGTVACLFLDAAALYRML